MHLRPLLKPSSVVLIALLAGCGQEDGAPLPDETVDLEAGLARGPHPALPHLPDLRGLALGACENTLGGCSLRSTRGGWATLIARSIYEDFFNAQWPKDEEAWAFRPITEDEQGLLETRPAVLPWNTGTNPPTKDEYKAWMSLRPDPWQTLVRRRALKSTTYVAPATLPFARSADPASPARNLELLKALAEDANLPKTDRTRARYYEQQNPYDWQSGAATHYEVPKATGGNIMASNFVWRTLMAPYQMEQALADCTVDPAIPCVGTVAALSDVDMHQVYELSFVREGEAGFEVSRVVRVVSVDSGHAIDVQSTQGPGATNVVTGERLGTQGTPFLITNRTKGPRLLWRLELDGKLAERMGVSGGAAAVLVRYSPSNGQGQAQRPAEGACTDFNDGEWKCDADARGVTKTYKCMGLIWQPYTTGCRIPKT